MDVYLTILVQTIHDRQPTSIIPATCMATSGDQYCNMQQLFVHALKHKNYELHTCHHQEIRPKQIETMLNGSRLSALQPGGEDMGNSFIRRRLSRVEVCRVSHEWSSPMRRRRQWKWDGFPCCSWHEPAHKTSKRASLGSPKRRLRHLVWQTRRAFGAHKPLLHVAFAHTTRVTKMACVHMTRVEPQESAGGPFIGY